ncbi:GroES-like protein [Lipomyces kononenkoae]
MSLVTFDVYRGSKSGQPIRQRVTRDLQPNEVFIRITHSGVCGTDEHWLHSEIALGHEGIGIIQQVGANVSSFKVDDRVGFGFIRQVCGVCDNCLSEWDQYCPHRRNYGAHDHDTGSFSTGAVCDAGCVFHIPAGYDSASAAPILCGGATVWTVLSQYNVRATDRVGVMGVGGLGHLAIKIAAAMGCHVVVLSSTESKREEAFRFGAKEFHVMRTGEPTQEGIEPLNHLLLCGSAKVDYDPLITLMAANGTIYPLTVDSSPSSIVLLRLIRKGAAIRGSNVASTKGIRKLLQFCARHDITPQIEQYPLNEDGIQTAMQALREGKVRYRAVLVAQ